MDFKQMKWVIEPIARICHEANRAYCQTIGDYSQQSWESAPEWQRESAKKGVLFHLQDGNFDPAASHSSWLREKYDQGWKWGPVKDVEKKEHPCMRPFDDLPLEQQQKDKIFCAIVKSFTE